jgi:hypothetical protein
MDDPLGGSDFWLLDVFGKPIRIDRFLFVPCALEFPFSEPQYWSSVCCDATLPAPAKHWWDDDVLIDWYDDATVFWTRGRMMALFDFQPVFSQTSWQRNCTFETAFLAIDMAVPFLRATPFVVTDWDGEPYDDYGGPDFVTRLAFSKTAGDVTRNAIAERFWSVLLQDTADVRPYSDFIEIADRILRVTFDTSGAILDCTTDDNVYFDEPPDNHNGYGYFPTRWCLDCEGHGEEYVQYPIRQTCETCGGSGVVSW